MKTRSMIPLALAALIGCADNVPTGPTPRALSLHPLLGAFPGNNGRLVYFDGLGGLVTMNPDGTGKQPLTSPGHGPSWNAAGTKIAFYAFAGDEDHSEIYVINADGSGKTQLTFNSTAPGVTFPTWSPNGSKIAYQNNFDGRIYVMNSDGTGAAAITTGRDGTPSWSPDGSKIAFTTSRHGLSEIYVMNADGTGLMRLTNNSEADFDPSWSPDGSKILFMHDDPAPGDWPRVWVMNADGSGAMALTNTADRADFSAVWSPDGSKIAFIGENDLNSEIYVMNADGSGQTNVSNTAARESSLDWQPLPVAPPACVFGPRVYTRTQGPPARITETFTATPGSYSVDLDDLATSGADAVVTLNGVVIMEGRGTTGEVGPRHKTITVTLLAENVLDIQLRGKRDSKLKVTICSSSGNQCYPNLPAPQLTLESTTVEGSFVRFEFDVPNYAQFPAELFAQAPDLAACGLNTSASRTWVDIYDGNGDYVHGFCSFSSPSDLNLIWVQTPVESRPAEVYITLTDRRCNTVYTSNRVNLGGGL